MVSISAKNNTFQKQTKQTSLTHSLLLLSDDFLATVDKKTIWFATMHFTYKTVSGGRRNKEVFFSYIPDVHITEKFGGVTAAGAFFKTLEGIQNFHCRVACSGVDDLELDNVLHRVSKFELDPVDQTVAPCSI